MNTPTPREEFEKWLETVKYDNSDILSPSGLAWGAWQAASKELTEALEELNSINAEREAHRGTRKAWIELDDNRQILEKQLKAVTEQRDEARKLAERYRNLSCDSQEEADATLLPWENNQPTEL